MDDVSSAESNSQPSVWFTLVVGNRIQVQAQTLNIAKEYALAYYQGLIPSSLSEGFIVDNDNMAVIAEQVKNNRS